MLICLTSFSTHHPVRFTVYLYFTCLKPLTCSVPAFLLASHHAHPAELYARSMQTEDHGNPHIILHRLDCITRSRTASAIVPNHRHCFLYGCCLLFNSGNPVLLCRRTFDKHKKP